MSEDFKWLLLIGGVFVLFAYQAGSVIVKSMWAFPQYDDLIQKYANLYDVPARWIRAIILTESSGDPDAIGPTGDYGLMQVTLSTARLFGYAGDGQGLLDPETNVNLGTQTIADILSRGITSPEEMYSAYNSGNPHKYQTNPQVAANVNRFIGNLQAV